MIDSSDDTLDFDNEECDIVALYVSGLLNPGQRREVEQRLQHDAELAASIRLMMALLLGSIHQQGPTRNENGSKMPE